MKAETKSKAHKFMLNRGYGKGSNFTTSAVSNLMAEFALSLLQEQNLNSHITGTSTKWKERAKNDRENREEIRVNQKSVLEEQK